MFTDKKITCKDCGEEFVFTANEQEFFAEKGFTNEPQRCQNCRKARKANSRGNNNGPRGNAAPRQLFDAICAECGKACKVPFEPRDGRPVYCRDCF